MKDSNSIDLESGIVWQKIFEQVPFQILELSLDGRILYMNKTFIDKPVEEIVNTSIFDYVPAKDRRRLKKAYRDVARTGKIHMDETSVILPDRSQKWFAYYITPHFRSGKVTKFIVINQDITEQKKASEALRESEHKFRTLAEQSPNMIFITKKGRIVFANRTLGELMGYTQEEFYAPDFDFRSLFAPESFPVVQQNFLRQMQEEEIPPQKESAEALKRAHADLERSVQGRTAELTLANKHMQLEIEERKNAEAALKASEAMLRTILDSSPDAISVIDRNANFIECNRAALQQFRFKSKQDMLGRNSVDLVAPKDQARAMRNIEETIRKGTMPNVEYKVLRRDGTEFDSETSASVIKDSKGAFNGFVVVTKDISARKVSEQALLRTQAELRDQKKALEQKNIALREIIAQVEIEKQKINEGITLNVQRVLLPILDQLEKASDPNPLLDVFRRHLDGLTSTYGSRITEKAANLTPREVEICNMIKGGLSSKDIAELLKISQATVERHRKNIRAKLRLTNQDINLATFLRNL
jgi:PAS domain S-box-containing protein